MNNILKQFDKQGTPYQIVKYRPTLFNETSTQDCYEMIVGKDDVENEELGFEQVYDSFERSKSETAKKLGNLYFKELNDEELVYFLSRDFEEKAKDGFDYIYEPKGRDFKKYCNNNILYDGA